MHGRGKLLAAMLSISRNHRLQIQQLTELLADYNNRLSKLKFLGILTVLVVQNALNQISLQFVDNIEFDFSISGRYTWAFLFDQ